MCADKAIGVRVNAGWTLQVCTTVRKQFCLFSSAPALNFACTRIFTFNVLSCHKI